VFVAKNLDATFFSALVRQWQQFGQFCIDFCAVTKRSETPQNMSFGSYGVDQWSGSGAFVAKIPARLCLTYLCDNGTSTTSFASTFVQ
jgi:hypothetical protein